MRTMTGNKNKTKIETRTKIVCTLGPASESETVLTQLIDAGMDVARINCAHGRAEEYERVISTLRSFSDKIAVLFDLAGPKIRVGEMAENIFLQENSETVLTTKKIVGNEEVIPQLYKELPCRVKKDDIIYIDEGLLRLRVLSIPNEQEIVCHVETGGELRSKRGINVPGVDLIRIPTPKDYMDIRTGTSLGVDYFGISFVKSGEDVDRIRGIITEYEADIPIISKIETIEAATPENFDKILQASDGIMVARGDLGVELMPEKVPLIQKIIIKKCLAVGIPVIVATQMLESMISNPRPTRAEASDVANAVLDGADAVMLSGETAIGKYPVQTVKVMDVIASITEEEFKKKYKIPKEATSAEEVIGECVNLAVERLGINAIIISTKTGFSCRMISKLRPKTSIIAITPYKAIYRRLSLIWGVTPLLAKGMGESMDLMAFESIKESIKQELITREDTIIYVAGSLLGLPAVTKTNMFQIYHVGTVLDSASVLHGFDYDS